MEILSIVNPVNMALMYDSVLDGYPISLLSAKEGLPPQMGK